MENTESIFMEKAIASAREGITCNHGGPFGACVVKDNEILATSHNTVIRDNDPTCHAEMNAIREASKSLNTHILSDCVLYTTAEPCPMCLAAIYWARIPKIIVGAHRKVAAKFGFDDDFFYEELLLPTPERKVKIVENISSKECESVFSEWKELKRPLY
jgi:guanine deaminase